eukprot:TRINITY_DN3454_c0_g1_i6.p1 TRINITY_DN3454_c0_g1~~TRINITY_DN3454_c0_g1_i6.p1  ORF type:complete len:127 (+),score=8.51 TRINITY_DN3454_c0_g1_i6:811-1191(+)
MNELTRRRLMVYGILSGMGSVGGGLFIIKIVNYQFPNPSPTTLSEVSQRRNERQSEARLEWSEENTYFHKERKVPLFFFASRVINFFLFFLLLLLFYYKKQKKHTHATQAVIAVFFFFFNKFYAFY